MVTEEIRIQNRDKILQAAKKLFMEDDVEKITLTRIADKAGVARRTVLNIFEEKNNLVFHVMSSFYEDFFYRIHASE